MHHSPHGSKRSPHSPHHPFPHPEPPLVSDPVTCTGRWERPVYAPTLVLTLPLTPEPPRPLLPPIKAPPPRRQRKPTPAPPSQPFSIDVERPMTESEWRERYDTAPNPRPRSFLEGRWSLLAVTTASGLLGVVSWFAVAQLGLV